MPHGGSRDKVQTHGWVVTDEPGRFELVSKHLLNVDHGYQRDHIREGRVNRICSEWSWVSYGVLTVGRRPDETLWVIDGQHRKLAADKRSDIDLLPCLVFDMAEQSAEAKAFLAGNDRGSVTVLDSFKALLAQDDATAVTLRAALTHAGYVVSKSQSAGTVTCIGTLYRAFKRNRRAAHVAWDLAVLVADGQFISERVFGGLFSVETTLERTRKGTLESHRRRFAASTIRELEEYIARSIAYRRKGGEKVCGEGVINFVNFRRKEANWLPSLYGDRPALVEGDEEGGE
jgi:hypothetical protein